MGPTEECIRMSSMGVTSKYFMAILSPIFTLIANKHINRLLTKREKGHSSSQNLELNILISTLEDQGLLERIIREDRKNAFMNKIEYDMFLCLNLCENTNTRSQLS